MIRKYDKYCCGEPDIEGTRATRTSLHLSQWLPSVGGEPDIEGTRVAFMLLSFLSFRPCIQSGEPDIEGTRGTFCSY